MTNHLLVLAHPPTALTCHWVKQLVGLQVGECAAAVGTVERRPVGRVAFVRLDASPHVVQLVLDHVDQQPVIDEVVIVARGLAIRRRLHAHTALDELVGFQSVQHGAQLLAVKLEQLQHVLLTHAGIADQHVQGQSMLDAVETTHHLLGQALQRRWDFSQHLRLGHHTHSWRLQEQKESLDEKESPVGIVPES